MNRSLLRLACVAAVSVACPGSNDDGTPSRPPGGVANHEVSTPAGASVAAPAVAPDGAGGMIMTWLEVPAVMHPTEIALRAHRPGHWPAGGVLAGTMRGEPAIGLGLMPIVQITPDDEGGAILAWSEYLTTVASTLSVQRVGADGTVRWAAGGVPVCPGEAAGPANGRDFALASDGAGGAVVAWVAGTNAGSFVAVQRLAGSDGAQLWGACGTRVGPIEPLGRIYTPKLLSGGAGALIVTWWRVVGGDLMAQRIGASDGTPLWVDPLVLLDTAGGDYDAVSDGMGGAIVVGHAMASAGNFDIIAQRVSSSGAVLWAPAGVTVTAAKGFKAAPRLAADGSGGAVVAWLDDRASGADAPILSSSAIYAQRVTGAGSVAWITDGVFVCGERIPHSVPPMQVISSGTGGAILAWTDDRDGVSHVFAQRLAGATGAAAWAAGGMHVTDAPGGEGPPVAISDGSGGATLVFTAWRTALAGLYSQRVTFDGTLP